MLWMTVSVWYSRVELHIPSGTIRRNMKGNMFLTSGVFLPAFLFCSFQRYEEDTKVIEGFPAQLHSQLLSDQMLVPL